MNPLQRYRYVCTLSFGDIYGQVMIWLIVMFVSLAAAVAMYQSPMYALLTSGLVLVLSLPFLLFAFVTTLLNHIELLPVENAPQQAGVRANASAAGSTGTGMVQPG